MRISDWSSDVCSSDLRCLAEFQDDSVQLVTAVSRVSERLHELSRQAAGQAHSNLGLVANAASGAVQVAENVRSVAFSSGRLVESIAEIRSQTQASQSIVDLAVDEARSAGEQVKLLLHSVDLIRKAASDIGEIAQQTNLLALNASIEAARAEIGRAHV